MKRIVTKECTYHEVKFKVGDTFTIQPRVDTRVLTEEYYQNPQLKELLNCSDIYKEYAPRRARNE